MFCCFAYVKHKAFFPYKVLYVNMIVLNCFKLSFLNSWSSSKEQLIKLYVNRIYKRVFFLFFFVCVHHEHDCSYFFLKQYFWEQLIKLQRTAELIKLYVNCISKGSFFCFLLFVCIMNTIVLNFFLSNFFENSW